MPRFDPPPRLLLIGLAFLTVFFLLAGTVLRNIQGGRDGRMAALSSRGEYLEVKLVVPDEEGAFRLQEEYQNQGHRVTAHPIQSIAQVESGFIVADRLDPIAAKPAAEALSKVYHFPVSLKRENGTKILVQVGPVYNKKEDAEKLAHHLQKLGYIWHVEPKLVEKEKIQFEVRISHVTTEQANEIKNSLPKHGIQVDLVQSP